MAMEKHGDDTKSDAMSSDAEDNGSLDSFEEITNPSDLKIFSIFLKKAQDQAQSTGKTRRTYTGCLRMTQYRCRKFCSKLRSKGFLSLPQFIERMKEKKQHISTVHKELEDGNSGTSQGSTHMDCVQGCINNYGGQDPGLSLPSVANNGSCALVHVL